MAERLNEPNFWLYGRRFETDDPKTRDPMIRKLQQTIGGSGYVLQSRDPDIGQNSWIYTFGYQPLSEEKKHEIWSVLLEYDKFCSPQYGPDVSYHNLNGNLPPGISDTLTFPKRLQDWARYIRSSSNKIS